MGGLNQDVLAHHHQPDQGGWGGIQVASSDTHVIILIIIITNIIMMIVTRPRVGRWVSIFVFFFNIPFHASADLASSSEDTPLNEVRTKYNKQTDRQTPPII